MKLPILKMKCLIAFLLCNFLPLAVARYKDLGHLCLDDTLDEKYKSVQANITYTATPYPTVKNDTNVTLTCTGRSIQPDFVHPDDLSYIIAVEFYKNSKALHLCREDRFRFVRRLSCKLSISGVTNDDKFWCIIRASNAPCNAAEISFQIQNIIPAPQNVKITNVTGYSVVVHWTVIKQKTEKHDVVTGYIVTVANQNCSFHMETSSNVSSVFVNQLLPNTSYIVSVVAISDKTKGMPSKSKRFKTSDLEHQPPTINNPGDRLEKTTKKQSNSTFTIVVPVVVAVGVIILLIALTIIGFRRRNKARNCRVPSQGWMKEFL